MGMMGYREYAAHRKAKGLIGGTLRAVQKAIDSKRIGVLEERALSGRTVKRIDSADADVRWAANTDQALQRSVPGAATEATTAPKVFPLLDGVVETAPVTLSLGIDWRAGGWDGPMPPAPPLAERVVKAVVNNLVNGESFREWKTREQRANALAAERALAVEERALLNAGEVEKTFVAMGRMYAQGRESVPTQLAPQLVGLTDLGEIERRVRAALRETDQRILREIRGQYAEVVDRVTAAR